MKFYLLSLVLLTFTAEAVTFKFETFDQEKLADLIDRMDRFVKRTQSMTNQNLIKRISVLETPDSELKITCERSYFNLSNHPSFTNCVVDLDESYSTVVHRFSEYEVSLYSPLANALYKAISFGNPVKVLRSSGRVSGVSLEGIEKKLFHYTLRCGPSECKFRFASP